MWARPLAAARTVIALFCLVFQLVLAPVDFVWFTSAIALFAASSLLAVFRPEMLEGALGLLTLFIDTVFFMVLARYGALEAVWLAPVFYLYLLTAAVTLYSPREVTLVSAVCILFALTPYPGSAQAFRATILACAEFASAFSFQKRWLKNQLDTAPTETAPLRDTPPPFPQTPSHRV